MEDEKQLDDFKVDNVTRATYDFYLPYASILSFAFRKQFLFNSAIRLYNPVFVDNTSFRGVY